MIKKKVEGGDFFLCFPIFLMKAAALFLGVAEGGGVTTLADLFTHLFPPIKWPKPHQTFNMNLPSFHLKAERSLEKFAISR